MTSKAEEPPQASGGVPEQQDWANQHLVNRPFTPKDLAVRWEVSERQVRKLAAEGKLVSFKIGTLYRFTREAVIAFEQTPAETGSNDIGSTADESLPPPDRRVVCLPDDRSVW